jgi:hypothetical protein
MKPNGVEDRECWIDTVDGEKVVFASAALEPHGTSYIRIVDVRGVEVVYWDSNEWREDPQGVMGAIMGAMLKGASSK